MAEKITQSTDTPNTVLIDLEKMRPDPQKIASEKRTQLLVTTALTTVLGGLAGYAIKESGKAAAIGAAIGGVGGFALTKLVPGKTYDEEAYDLIKDSTQNITDPATIRKNLADKMKQRDLEAALLLM